MDLDFDNISTLIKHAGSGVKLAGKAVTLTRSIKDLLSSSKAAGNPELETPVVELMGEVTDTKRGAEDAAAGIEGGCYSCANQD